MWLTPNNDWINANIIFVELKMTSKNDLVNEAIFVTSLKTMQGKNMKESAKQNEAMFLSSMRKTAWKKEQWKLTVNTPC